ncbi:MAG TPA: tape measure protein, partial [Nannocystis sp.]
MAELDRLYVRVLADIQDLEKKMAVAEQRVFRFGGQMRAVGKGMTLGLTAPLVALGGVATAAAADLDRLRRGLDVSAGSAADAARQFADLERIARMPGLGFREAIQGAVQLNTVLEGMPNRLRLSSRLLEQFGNAIALTGGGRAELDRVIMQLGQMAASGRVLTADLRPIIQTAPAVATALRQAFGTIDAQEIERLGLSSQEFFERLLRGLESLPRAAAGPANAMENFTDAAFRARAAVGRALLPAVADLTNQFADMLEQVDELDPRMVRLGIAFGAALAVAGPLTVAIGGLTTALVALKAAGVSLTLALGGPGALIAGLSLLVGWWVKNKLEAAAFREELAKIRQSAASAAVSLTPEDTLRVLGGRRQALANLQARRAEIIAERRAQLARIGPSGGGADLSDEAIIRGLGGRAREEFQAIERAIASTTGAIAALEAHYIAASKAAENLGTKAAASMPALDLTLDTFQRLREAEARAMEELQELTIERVLAAGTEEAERLNEQFRATERWLAAIRAQLARFPSDASVLTPQAGMVQSIRPGLPTPSTAPVQAVGGWGLQWAVDTLSEALRRGQWI